MDPLALVISKYMNAETMGKYSYSEFETGFKNLNVNSIDEFKKKLPQLRQELNNGKDFKELYKFIFDFSRD